MPTTPLKREVPEANAPTPNNAMVLELVLVTDSAKALPGQPKVPATITTRDLPAADAPSALPSVITKTGTTTVTEPGFAHVMDTAKALPDDQ